LKSRALQDRFVWYKSSQQYPKAYGVGLALLDQSKPEEQRERLNLLYDITCQGNLLARAPELLSRAKKIGVTDKDLAPFHFLSGKAHFQRSQCKLAISDYETALALDNAYSDSAEARYRLGKCLSRVHQPTQARKIWEELVGMKDTFWSPLAKNELRLMRP